MFLTLIWISKRYPVVIKIHLAIALLALLIYSKTVVNIKSSISSFRRSNESCNDTVSYVMPEHAICFHIIEPDCLNHNEIVAIPDKNDTNDENNGTDTSKSKIKGDSLHLGNDGEVYKWQRCLGSPFFNCFTSFHYIRS